MPKSNVELLKNLLDYTSLKQKVISKNIANSETLGYRRKDIQFKDFLEDSSTSSIRQTNSKHISMNEIEKPLESKIKIIDDKNAAKTTGVNNVDLDKEMAEMAENTIMFKFAARKLNGYYRTMQKVIKGGGA
ncbi:MAG: flagellar basal body rod protein FlgB [Melioribacteraceae bacterium]|nr:MAG: flagellar basal body rod protein FlgB [Melioribacteraceae bacterium]